MELVEYVVNSIDGLQRKISLPRGGSYTDSPDPIKNKSETINTKNSVDKYF